MKILVMQPMFKRRSGIQTDIHNESNCRFSIF